MDKKLLDINMWEMICIKHILYLMVKRYLMLEFLQEQVDFMDSYLSINMDNIKH